MAGWKEKYYNWRANGLCGFCGANTQDGKSTCDKCGERQSRSHKARYHDLRSKGLCGHCSAPSVMAACERCLEKKREYVAKRDRKKIYAKAKKRNEELGACVRCAKPVAERYRNCRHEKGRFDRLSKAGLEMYWCTKCDKRFTPEFASKKNVYCDDCRERIILQGWLTRMTEEARRVRECRVQIKATRLYLQTGDPELLRLLKERRFARLVAIWQL